MTAASFPSVGEAPPPGERNLPGAGDPPLSQQLQAIAFQLWALAADAPAHAGTGGGESGLGESDRDRLIALVEQDYRDRRERGALFNDDLFGEPAWDILLYLYAAQLRGDLVVTSSLARAAAVPMTTALRWIAHLEAANLIERCTIKRDGRVRVQRLTRTAAGRLDQYYRRRLARTRPGWELSVDPIGSAQSARKSATARLGGQGQSRRSRT